MRKLKAAAGAIPSHRQGYNNKATNCIRRRLAAAQPLFKATPKYWNLTPIGIFPATRSRKRLRTWWQGFSLGVFLRWIPAGVPWNGQLLQEYKSFISNIIQNFEPAPCSAVQRTSGSLIASTHLRACRTNGGSLPMGCGRVQFRRRLRCRSICLLPM